MKEKWKQFKWRKIVKKNKIGLGGYTREWEEWKWVDNVGTLIPTFTSPRIQPLLALSSSQLPQKRNGPPLSFFLPLKTAHPWTEPMGQQ